MKKADIGTLPIFFDRYINLCENLELMEAFEKYSPEALVDDPQVLASLGDFIYAPGKWSIKDIFQHIIDNERIMCYRALRFSRADYTPLQGYQEDLLASNTVASSRQVSDLIEEWKVVRQGTILMFKHMSEAMLLRKGLASEIEISALALAFVIIGHPIHHMNVIKERYL
jgi:hypothetical protein